MSEVGEHTSGRRLGWAAFLLGFGLGGFFDGILLHQILQWHHLLSGVEAARQDIGLLIVTDGLFHLLMYIVTGVGLWLLWRGWHGRTTLGDSRFMGLALLGFGGWHLADAILSHWLLGIHRIRMDVDNPLLWDLGWLALFGLIPLGTGFAAVRRRSMGAVAMSSPLALVLAAAVAGPLAALPPAGSDSVTVLFRPGVAEADAFAAMQAVGGRLAGTDSSGRVWVVSLPERANPLDFYRHGALLVSGTALAGCLNWMQT
jgi:uncharacterized membrane protein